MIASRQSDLLALLPMLALLACSGAGALGPRASGGMTGYPATSSGAPASEPGGAEARANAAAPAERPGLGTRFGEDRHAPAHDVAFERQGGPVHLATLHYDDSAGVAALRARA